MGALENLGAVIADPDLRGLLRSVITRKINSDLKTIQAHAELSRRLSASRRMNGNGETETLKRIVKDHLEYYGTLVDLSLSFHQRLLDMLAETSRGKAVEPAINGLTLAMSAPRGATVRAPFKIANNRTEPIQVTCRSSPFIREDGSQMIASQIAFLPPSAEIAGGSEEVFEIILPVGNDFAPGNTYLATISTEGFEAVDIVIRLAVEGDARETVPPAPPEPKSTPSQGRKPRKPRPTP
ncbi:hypothetical protein [Sphingomonas arenae]|uniref:hypothetical protein n=1 Tax=Sphingomonas arenae TaxID=2812555 RepID=UPI0019679A8B|nr:hypothetical protein [Sphingomonas arenae]